MIVVADTSPLHYVVLAGAVEVLQLLYTLVLVPQTVAGELQGAGTPDTVETWITDPPHWCEIRPDPPSEPGLELLDPGERAAITLALSLKASRLLIDEWEGRAEAERRHLRVTGTLGILAEAHRRRLVDFEEALALLRRTNFYLSAELIERVRRRLSTGDGLS
jgi:predicted nucleic acid-binding protein